MNAQEDAVTHGTLISPADFKPSSSNQEVKEWRLNKTYLSLCTAAIIALVITWFLVTARTLSFSTEPAHAKVELSGGFIIPIGQQFLLKPGQYQLSAYAEGYHIFEQTLKVDQGKKNQLIPISLKKLPGILRVETLPPTNANIYIDDKLLGEANQAIKNIEAGEHKVSIESERFLPLETQINIEGLNKTQTLTLELQPAWATIHVTTQPSGATVYIDGKDIGTTPMDAEIVQGERELLVKLAGHEAWSTSLEVIPGEDQTLPEVVLSPADALVMIQSKPDNASITINDKYYGQTPLEVALPPAENYQLTLFRDGFQAASKRFDVKTGEDTSLSLSLQPDLANISIVSSPNDALLYIDGRLMGRANQELTLPAKQHQVLIQKEGFVDYKTTILPRPGLSQNLSPKLKTLEEAKWEDTPLISKTANGQEIKLFRPEGKNFKTGASRREAGRRANEVQRNIALSRAFYLSTTMVTNKHFRQFAPQHSSSHYKSVSLDSEKHPAVNLSWQSAALYCNWLSEKEKLTPFYTINESEISGFNPQANGYRLPTEAEWVWIARVKGDNKLLKYPWGAKLPPAKDSGNYADRTAAKLLGQVFWEYNDNFPTTSPVGYFAANFRGIYDIGGNASEWMNDFYEIKTGLAMKTEQDPLGPTKGDYHVIRGSSWMHSGKIEMRLSFRDYGFKARKDVGFRIARWVD